jgi:hypothetical protein
MFSGMVDDGINLTIWLYGVRNRALSTVEFGSERGICSQPLPAIRGIKNSGKGERKDLRCIQDGKLLQS